jgi:hypothetical protein
MTYIHAEDAAVVIHEPERVEAEPRCAKQCTRAKYGEPASRCKTIVAVAPGSATARIEHEVAPAPIRQLLDAIDHILRTVGQEIDDRGKWMRVRLVVFILTCGRI